MSRHDERDTEIEIDDAADAAELARLERALAPVRLAAPPRPRPRRRAGWIAAAILATALAVTALVPTSAIPSRVAALFHADFPGEIGVRGGTRIEYQVPDGAATDAVAAALERRGADVVFARPGLLVVDAVGERPAAARGWAEALAGPRDLGFHRMADPDGLAARLAAASPIDALEARSDTWRVDDGEPRVATYLVAPDRAALEAGLIDHALIDPSLAVPPSVRVAFEAAEHDGRPEVRAYLLEAAPALTHDHIALAEPFVDPRSGRTDLLIQLDPAGAGAFAALTRDSVGDKIAVRVGDQVVMAPVVQSPVEGGFVQLTSGERGDGWARGLAGALRGPELPAEVTLGSLVEVAPVLTPVTALAARGVLGLVAGLVAGLLAWLAVRTAPAADPEVSPVRGRVRRRPWRRVAVTVGAVSAVAALAYGLGVSGIAASSALGLEVHRSFALPVLAGLVLVELAIAAVPRWRRGLATAAGRRLAIAGFVALVALVSLLEAAALAEFVEQIGRHDDLEGTPLAAPIFAAVAPLAILVVAAVFAPNGLVPTAGLIILVVAAGELGTIASELSSGTYGAASPVAAGPILAAVLAAAATIAATAWLLRRRVSPDRLLAPRLPAGGVLAVAAPGFVLGGLLALQPLLPPAAGDAIAGFAFGADRWLVSLLAIALAPLVALLALRRARSSASVKGDPPAARARRRAVRLAVGLTTGYVALLVVLDLLAPGISPGGLATMAWLALATAVGLDLVAEARARFRRDDLAPVARIADPQDLDIAIEALAGRGLDVHVRGAALRSALVIGGSIWPAVVEVPTSRRAEARDLLAAVFAETPERCVAA
jgi:hypothetical protein